MLRSRFVSGSPSSSANVSRSFSGLRLQQYQPMPTLRLRPTIHMPRMGVSLSTQDNIAMATKFLRIQGVVRSARRKDIVDTLDDVSFDPSKLIAKYNMNYVRLEEWNLEVENETEAEKALSKKYYIGGKPLKMTSIAEEVYNREKDRLINMEGGKAILISNITNDTDSFELHRLLSGFSIANVVILKDEKGRPAGKAIVIFNSEQEAHRAVLEKHRRQIRGRFIEIEILD